MPHFWNNILVVTKNELIPHWWPTYNALKLELYRHKDKNYGVKRVRTGGNGRQMLISYDSLSREIQNGLGDPRKHDHILEQFYETDSQAVEYYTSFTRPDGSYLTPEETERYIVNASVVKAILLLQDARITERMTKGFSARGVTATLAVDAQTFREVLRVKHNEDHNLPAHPRRFKETLTNYENDSYYSLIKDPEGKRKDNARKVTTDTMNILNNMFATQPHKPTPTEVARQYNGFLSGHVEVINNETGELYDPEEFKLLSKSTITHFLAQWQSKIGTYKKRSGDRQKLMQQFKPHHSLEAPKFAGSLISIDDRQPPFEYAKGKRMWFYNGIDLASEAFICWVYGDSKEGLIIDFYRQLVRNYHEWGLNLPYGIECESSLNSSFKDTFLKPGAMFEDVRIEANNARGKRIEAFYKPLRYDLEKEREGWLARPFAISESNQAGPGSKQIIPFNDIAEGCLNDIMTWNNMEHSKHKGISRWDYFVKNQLKDSKPTNYKAILPGLGKHTISSCRAGIIKLQYGEYLLGDNGSIALGSQLVDLMKRCEGKEFDIYWLDDNDGKVFKALIYMNGRYICEAIPKPIYNRANNEREDDGSRELMSSYVASIEAYQKSQAKSIEPVTIIDNKPKTISKSFKMPGMPKPVETVDFNDHDVEVLPQPDNNDDLKPVETDFNTPLIERF